MKTVAVFAACLVMGIAHPLVKTPYTACAVDTSCEDSSYDIQNLNIALSPDPPQAGKDVTITINGKLNKEVSGGDIKLVVTYSGVTILDETYDVCDILKDVDEKCPLSAGDINGSATEQIPSSAPAGIYVIKISGTDQDGGNLLCAEISCTI